MVAKHLAQPLDRERLLDLYGDDTAYAADMFETFLHDVVPQFDSFNPLIQEQRWMDVYQLAHKLKPTLGLVGLSDLEAVMNDIESSAASPDPFQVQRMWHDFRANFTERIPIVYAEWQRYLRKQTSL
ncbi:Hpt domain-containing protein [Spirosoma soli]|uniref:Hpt domain-containing protein n=1 Tax=Spirosoma soli TaxID=1770529 RepID=A0ABW5MCH9_9BACT